MVSEPGKLIFQRFFWFIFIKKYFYIIYYYEFSSRNWSMAILEDRQSDFGYTVYFRFDPLISIVVAQRIWFAQITIIWVSRITTSRYIWVVSQDLIKFILEKHYILSGNIPDTPRERVPQITRGIGERAVGQKSAKILLFLRKNGWKWKYVNKLLKICFPIVNFLLFLKKYIIYLKKKIFWVKGVPWRPCVAVYVLKHKIRSGHKSHFQKH